MMFGSLRDIFKKFFLFIRNIFIKEKQKYVSARALGGINLTFKNVSPYYDLTLQKTIMALAVATIILGIVLFFAYNDIKQNLTKNSEVIEKQAMKIIISNPQDFLNSLDYKEIGYKIKKNDTFVGILVDKIKIDYNTAYEIIRSVQRVYNLRNLRVGQEINFKFKRGMKIGSKNEMDSYTDLKELTINDGNLLKKIVVTKKDDKYVSWAEDVKLNLLYNKYFARIKNGLYVDAVAAGIPPDVVITIMNQYSFDIDFQRDIKVGDTIEVIFEAFYTENGAKVKNGEIVFSNLYVNKKNYNLYRLTDKNSRFVGYFDYNGLSTEKSLMITPISGARISSGYNLRRKHPVLGYTREHRGIDFAAPVGTPFYAAGKGTVIKVISNCKAGNRRCGNGYGNYIQIKHGDNY
ncbi:MAG: peptidoglycan DD-metalloendopeptidase family protein, partial [Rickettsiales bacterium]|nr:peptidoglycan DD-metalloendopeptidase family protein [Rickettsiales bacterium]